MKYGVLFTVISTVLTGCMQYITPKPVVNVYYIQDENRTNHPIVKTKGKSISVGTAKKDEALKSNKIQLYFVYREKCPACEQLKEIMRRDDIEKILEKDFEVIRIHIRDKYTLPKAWMRPFRTPTVYFLSSKQEELIPSIHNMNARRFKDKLLEALEERDKSIR